MSVDTYHFIASYVDQLRAVATSHGGLFTGTTGVIHQALRRLPGDRPTISRADLSDFLPRADSQRPQSANYPGLTITRATWRGRGGADVYFLDAGSMEHAEATITDAAYQPRPDIIVVIARCNRCQRKVTHGAGQLSEAHRVVGTDRVRHCQCVIPGYI